MIRDLGMAAVEILKLLRETPRLSPMLIAEKLGMTPGVVRNVLMILSELRLVATPSRGIYQITALGKYVLDHVSKS
jgi:DNA-binding IclR family transcriptional regulator